LNATNLYLDQTLLFLRIGIDKVFSKEFGSRIESRVIFERFYLRESDRKVVSTDINPEDKILEILHSKFGSL
jgi:hypothetical protein